MSKLSAALAAEAIQLSGCQNHDKNQIQQGNNEEMSLLPTSILSVVVKVPH